MRRFFKPQYLDEIATGAVVLTDRSVHPVRNLGNTMDGCFAKSPNSAVYEIFDIIIIRYASPRNINVLEAFANLQ